MTSISKEPDRKSRNSAPVCLFVYARLNETKQAIESLKKNHLAPETDLHIFSDGPKLGKETSVSEIRAFLRQVSGFKSVTIVEQLKNLGLANSIILGVSDVINKYGRAIILEDDLLVSDRFLDYMNQCLDKYEDSNRVLSISGFSFPIKFPEDYSFDNTFGVRASSWGWATWKDRWNKVDWLVKSYPRFKYNPIARFRFNQGGSDLSRMLGKQMSGKINSWAIRFCFHQFENCLVDVYPTKSLVENIGWGPEASHCKPTDQHWKTIIWPDPPSVFNLSNEIKLLPSITKQFRSYNSFIVRLKRLILSFYNSKQQG